MQVVYILKSTPFYVYLLFIYLMFIGIKATKPRVVLYPVKLFIMPLVFLAFFIKQLNRIEDFLLVFVLIIISISINLKLLQSPPVHTDNNTLIIAGSQKPLLVIIAIFSIKYLFGYMRTVKPQLAQQYEIIELITLSLMIGMTLSKALFYYRYAVLKELQGVRKRKQST